MPNDERASELETETIQQQTEGEIDDDNAESASGGLSIRFSLNSNPVPCALCHELFTQNLLSTENLKRLGYVLVCRKCHSKLKPEDYSPYA